MTIFSGIHANSPNARFLAPGTLDHAHKLGSGEYEYLPRLRGTTKHPLPSSEAALRYSHQASEHHRSLSSGLHIPFLTPDKPESFREILKDGRGAHEFEFAVNDVHGTEIIVNTDSKVTVSYNLSSRFNDPYWGEYNWTKAGSVTPGEPLNTTQLLQPGETYTLFVKFRDSGVGTEVKGDVTIHHSDSAKAARFTHWPGGSNLDHYRGPSIFNKYTTVPIKVGSTYEDQVIGLNLGGGCSTIYPCKGQERVRVSTLLEDRLLTKYGHIRFNNRISGLWENGLTSIFEHPDTIDDSEVHRANTLYRNDTDETFSPEGTVKREYFNDFYIGSGKPVIICLEAQDVKQADGSFKTRDQGEQYLFPFSVTSLDGNNQCDLAREFNWQPLTPSDNPVKSWLREHAKYIGPAAGAGLLLMTAAFYYYKSKSQANLTNLTTAPQSNYMERRTSPDLPTGASDDLRVENARVLYPSTICLSDFERDFSCISDLTDAELEAAISDQTLTTLILRGCSHLTDATWDTIKQQKHLVYLDLTGCTNMSADGFLNIRDELSSLEQCHLPFNENRSESA